MASPLGFATPTRAYYADVLLPALRAAGLEPLDPWEDDGAITKALAITDATARRRALTRANRAIGRRNEQLIQHSAGVFAVLDGPDVDSGTAAEIGYAAAIGRPIVGWRSDFRLAGDNEAGVVNLQVAFFIERSGGAIESDLDRAIRRLQRLISKPPLKR